MVNAVINLANKHIISLYPEKVNVLYLFTCADFKHFICGFTGVLPNFCFVAGEGGFILWDKVYKAVTNVYNVVTNIDFGFCGDIIESRT